MKWRNDLSFTDEDPNYRNVSFLNNDSGDQFGAIWFNVIEHRWAYGCSNCNAHPESFIDDEESAKALLIAHVRMDCEGK